MGGKPGCITPSPSDAGPAPLPVESLHFLWELVTEKIISSWRRCATAQDHARSLCRRDPAPMRRRGPSAPRSSGLPPPGRRRAANGDLCTCDVAAVPAGHADGRADKRADAIRQARVRGGSAACGFPGARRGRRQRHQPAASETRISGRSRVRTLESEAVVRLGLSRGATCPLDPALPQVRGGWWRGPPRRP